MIITINSKIHLPLAELRPENADEVKDRLSFKNPAYGEAIGRLKAMGKANARPYNIPETIIGWSISKGDLILPRGCMGDLLQLLNNSGHYPKVSFNDQTRKLPEVDFKFHGLLKPAQEPAVKAILERRLSTISSPTGSGKTVMGLYVITQRRQPALVVVHITAIMKQWIDRAAFFLRIPPSEIGIIGQGSKTVGKKLTIALVQTLRKCAKDIAPKIGHIIVDECHHQPASTFREAITPFDCAYALGLSATHKRRDGLTPLIYWYVGPLVYEVSRNTLIKNGDIIQVEPVIRETNFVPSPDIDPTWQRATLIQELTTNHTRNVLIANDVVDESKNGPCIVLTDRKEHAETLARIINSIRWYREGSGCRAEVCHGDVPRAKQEQIIAALNDGRLQVLVATGQLLGEGFDCKRLTALFLATPIKFSGRLIQYLGRVARVFEGKSSAKVYDYHDVNVPVLMRAARERMRTYKRLARQAQGPTPKEK